MYVERGANKQREREGHPRRRSRHPLARPFPSRAALPNPPGRTALLALVLCPSVLGLHMPGPTSACHRPWSRPVRSAHRAPRAPSSAAVPAASLFSPLSRPSFSPLPLSPGRRGGGRRRGLHPGDRGTCARMGERERGLSVASLSSTSLSPLPSPPPPPPRSRPPPTTPASRPPTRPATATPTTTCTTSASSRTRATRRSARATRARTGRSARPNGAREGGGSEGGGGGGQSR